MSNSQVTNQISHLYVCSRRRIKITQVLKAEKPKPTSKKKKPKLYVFQWQPGDDKILLGCWTPALDEPLWMANSKENKTKKAHQLKLVQLSYLSLPSCTEYHKINRDFSKEEVTKEVISKITLPENAFSYKSYWCSLKKLYCYIQWLHLQTN